MEPINGITIQKYAELCALMAETGEDKAKQVAIASEHGVSEADWEAAKAGWTAKMTDPSDMGKTALAFMAAMQDAQVAARGGAEPGPMEDFAKVHAEMAFLKDEEGKPLDHKKIIEKYGYTYPKWLEMENYWTPRTQVDENPEFKRHYNEADAMKFKVLLQKETDIIFGIKR